MTPKRPSPAQRNASRSRRHRPMLLKAGQRLALADDDRLQFRAFAAHLSGCVDQATTLRRPQNWDNDRRHEAGVSELLTADRRSPAETRTV
jgi:hypothetical protein